MKLSANRTTPILQLCAAAFLLAAFALAAPALAAAQDAAPPDISGTWALNLAKSKINDPPKSETLTIKSKKNELVFDYNNGGNAMPTETFKLDGKSHASEQDGPFMAVNSKARWDNTTLVIESAIQFAAAVTGGGNTSPATGAYTDKWSLSADSKALTRDSTSSNGESIWVYDRQ